MGTASTVVKVFVLTGVFLFSPARAFTAENGEVICITNCSNITFFDGCPDLDFPVNITASPLCGLSSELVVDSGALLRITRLYCDGYSSSITFDSGSSAGAGSGDSFTFDSGSSAGAGSGGSFNTTEDDLIVFVEGSTSGSNTGFLRFTTQSGVVSEAIHVERMLNNFTFDLGLGLLEYETFNYSGSSFEADMYRFSYICQGAVPPFAPYPPLLRPPLPLPPPLPLQPPPIVLSPTPPLRPPPSNPAPFTPPNAPAPSQPPLPPSTPPTSPSPFPPASPSPPAAPSPASPSPAAPPPTNPSPTAPSPTSPSPAVPPPTSPSPTAPSPTSPSPAAPSPTRPSPAAPPLASPTPPPPSPSSPAPSLSLGEDGDDPCFDRATTTACKVRSFETSAIKAYQTCFGDDDKPAMHAPAERVLMSELRAGDLVLDSKNRFTRVVVNQHVHSASNAQVLNIQHEGGLLSLTADHMLVVNGGELRPARMVTTGASLSGFKVLAVTSGRSGIINPITASGLILAASTTGQPVIAAAGNEWLADVMLSSYPQYTLSYALASAFPDTVQRFYDAVLEPLFNALVPTLASLKNSAPRAVMYSALVLSDLTLAAGFGIFTVLAFPGLIVACCALAVAVKLCRPKF